MFKYENIVHLLKESLLLLNPAFTGKIYIDNQFNYGEAEYKIMDHISSQIEKKKEKQID